jgi:FtsP/CotA-like multicopper oxidase with cupredoxin domain/cytochrome oxidase Cu insertion factor (SCO1/SenC/PrrC family)
LPQVHSVDGVLKVTLDARAQKVALGGVSFEGMVFNGVYGGPTLRVHPGDVMKVRLVNHLDQPTNLHFHGYRGSPLGRSDSMWTVAPPGAAVDYLVRIPRSQPPGLYWYHAHMHTLADRQIMAGLSGMLVVEGLEREIAGLRGIRHALFGLKQYSVEDSEDPTVNTYFHGLIKTINGGLMERLELRPGETGLWSFVNEDADLPISLRLEGHSFRVIARDGQAGRREMATDVLVIPPAGRVEALVDAGVPGTYALTANRLTGSGDEQTSVRTMGILTVAGAPARPRPTLTRFPHATDLRGRRIDAVRTFTLTETPIDNHYYINGKLFDHHRIDTRVPLGHIEEWVIRNDSDDYHAFHVHQLGFQVVEVNGQPQPFDGYLDTVTVPERGEIKIRLAFTDPLIVGRFMYHCHVLEHEDKGMMGVIEVFDPKAKPPPRLSLSPSLRLFDQFGRVVTAATFERKPTLMFFGYTTCPAVCPVTLARMGRWLKALGPKAARLNLVFVSVDPQRDTAPTLRAYMASFDPRIRALTGPLRAIDRLARAYGVYYKKVPSSGGGYSVDHSAETYVLDAHGAEIGRIGYDESDASVLPKLRRLIG